MISNGFPVYSLVKIHYCDTEITPHIISLGVIKNKTNPMIENEKNIGNLTSNYCN